ncbi:MAG: hypothetical protein AAFN30_14165 [Actinomycetota bacterium]
MSSSTPEGRRRRRFSADEARAALLEAGAELLEERGMANGLGRVTLSDAVGRSGVPRPSAYRLFADGEFDPQEEFRMELLLYLLDISGTGPQIEEALHAPAAADDLAPLLASEDPDQWAYVLREGLRRGTNLIWQSTTIREAASRVTALSLVMDPDPYLPLLEAYRTRRAITVGRERAFYEGRLATFGLRVKDGYGIDDLASLIALGLEQIWDGTLAYGPTPSFQRPTGLGGEVVPWTPFGITVEGLILTMVEADPAAAVSARLSAWLEPPPKARRDG